MKLREENRKILCFSIVKFFYDDDVMLLLFQIEKWSVSRITSPKSNDFSKMRNFKQLKKLNCQPKSMFQAVHKFISCYHLVIVSLKVWKKLLYVKNITTWKKVSKLREWAKNFRIKKISFIHLIFSNKTWKY